MSFSLSFLGCFFVCLFFVCWLVGCLFFVCLLALAVVILHGGGVGGGGCYCYVGGGFTCGFLLVCLFYIALIRSFFEGQAASCLLLLH